MKGYRAKSGQQKLCLYTCYADSFATDVLLCCEQISFLHYISVSVGESGRSILHYLLLIDTLVVRLWRPFLNCVQQLCDTGTLTYIAVIESWNGASQVTTRSLTPLLSQLKMGGGGYVAAHSVLTV